MHASSNFVILLDGKKKDREAVAKMLSEYLDEAESNKKFVFEETYEVVWLEDIVSLCEEMANTAPDIKFVVSGYVDCSENSGEFMDFGIIYKNGKLTTYSSDWLGYDDLEQNEDGGLEESDEMGRYDRFLELQDLELDNVKEAMQFVIDDIKGRQWLNKPKSEV